MTIYTVPPDSDFLVVGAGDFLYILDGGTAIDTRVHTDGTEVVETGGVAINTTVNGGLSKGGLEIVEGGMSFGTVLVGSDEVVKSGVSNDTELVRGGRLMVFGGVENNVTCGGYSGGDKLVTLSDPQFLKGTIGD